MATRIIFLLLLVATSSTSSAQQSNLKLKGQFHGRLVLIPLDNGRDMQLEEAFSYTDWENHTLEAPAGFISDGASIPRAAWSLIGGPWDGKYRAAAVIHDVGCVNRSLSWHDTDRLFYEAMIDSGVPNAQASTMYYAVLAWGPHWELIAAPKATSAKKLSEKMTITKDALENASSDNAKAKKTETTGNADKDGRVAERSVEAVIGGKKTYNGYLYIVHDAKPLPEEKLKTFLAEAQARQRSSPMTPDEVEQRAAKENPSISYSK
jgi:hypothetical protein